MSNNAKRCDAVLQIAHTAAEMQEKRLGMRI